MAVRFDAATDQVERASAPAPGVAGLTVTGWAYLSVDTNGNATLARISASGATVGNLATQPDGQTLAWFTAGGSVISPLTMTAGAWHRVAATVTSGGACVVYGAPATGATVSASGTVSASSSADRIALGGRGAGDLTEWWNGRLAHVRAWTAVLTQGEIESEWASPVPVRTSGLWADWPLPSPADLTDHSGNGRDLTAGSTATTDEAGPDLGDLYAAESVTAAVSATPAPAAGVVAAAASSTPAAAGAAGTVTARLQVSATAAATSSTSARVTVAGLVATDLVGAAMLSILDQVAEGLDPVPGRVALYPGASVAWDDCCDGQVWVRLIDTQPVQPAGPSRQPSPNCGPVAWAVILGVGVLRCAASLDEDGAAPAASALTGDTLQMTADRAAVLQVLDCDVRPQCDSLTYLRWLPLGPDGGCVGGEWQVRLLVTHCPC